MLIFKCEDFVDAASTCQPVGWGVVLILFNFIYPITTESKLLMRHRPPPPNSPGMGTFHKIRNNIINKILDSTDKFTGSEGEQKGRCQDSTLGKLWRTILS